MNKRKEMTVSACGGRAHSAKPAYLAAFFGPVLILFTILALSGVWPFGTECFLRTDLYHQYAPFFSELREKLNGGGSLLYSWDVGLGVNFTALYAYYLASPLNWFLVFWPENYIIEFMMLLVVLKIGLCGISMTWYLRDRFRTGDFGTALFGIFYALSAYLAAYYWDIMWLDCIVLFPLIARGLERLCEEKKGLLYAASLGLCILSNYYISIMICMFLVLYFAALCVLLPSDSLRAFLTRSLRFAGYSLLAGGLSAVLLFPEIAALSHTASYEMNFPRTVTQYFTVIDMLARHLVGVETEQGLDHWPNIYCGVAVLPLFLLFLRSARVRLREKAVYSVLLLFFLMSFSLNVLNFIWHGFHYPNSLPARQSFLYIFLLLCAAYMGYRSISESSSKTLGAVFLATAAFILLCQKWITARHFQWWVYYVSLFLVSVYLLLAWLYQSGRLRRVSVLFLAFFVVLSEEAANMALTSVTTTSRTAYTEDNEAVRELVSGLFPSSEFFRIEKVNRKTKNDGAWLHFPSVSLFSSMANADCTDFFRALGCESSTNAYSITGSTPFVNMLFSVRYGLYGAAQEDGAEKKFIESIGNTYLYRNNFSLPLGFMMPEAMRARWVQDMDNPALVQDALCDMLGTEAVLQPNGELPSENGADLAVTISEDGEYYAFVTNPQLKKVTVTSPTLEKTFENVDRGYLLELGNCKAGDMVNMKSGTDGQEMQAQIYRFDYGALSEVYEALSAQPLRLSVWEDDRLSGTVDVSARALGYSEGKAVMFFSIPYDEGWQLTVDGEPAETCKVFDTFLGAELPDGTHEIGLRFLPQGLREGAALSAGSLLLLLCLFLLGRRNKRRAPEERGAQYPETEGEDGLSDTEETFPGFEETEESPETEDWEEDEEAEASGAQTEEAETGSAEDEAFARLFSANARQNALLERLDRMQDREVPLPEETAEQREAAEDVRKTHRAEKDELSALIELLSAPVQKGSGR